MPHYKGTVHPTTPLQCAGQPYFGTCKAEVRSTTLLMAHSTEYSTHLPASSYCFACDSDSLTCLLTSSRTTTTTLASLSIFFLDPCLKYKYSDTGSGAAGYISSTDIFSFGPSNSLFQTIRGSWTKHICFT